MNYNYNNVFLEIKDKPTFWDSRLADRKFPCPNAIDETVRVSNGTRVRIRVLVEKGTVLQSSAGASALTRKVEHHRETIFLRLCHPGLRIMIPRNLSALNLRRGAPRKEKKSGQAENNF